MRKSYSKDNLPESLILALADNRKCAGLRTICHRLKEKGKTRDYVNDCEITYLDLLQYGVSGIKFSQINKLFD